MNIEQGFIFLTLDLSGVTDAQRNKFYEKLTELNWRKSTDVTTAWLASWKEDVALATMVKVAKDDCATAAAYAGVTKYQALAAPCGTPTKWVVG